jgi:ribosome recycling factor
MGLDATPVQPVPFVEYASVFVSDPAATHTEPFHAIALPIVEKGLDVTDVQLVPLVDVANL